MGSYNASEHCNMAYNASMYCNLGSFENLTRQCGSFTDFCQSIDSCVSDSKLEEEYSAPVVGIGIYISAASLCCIVAMALDLWSGIKNRKFWFPAKYFSLNAVSITLIGVAMKLPLDMSSPMPGEINQVAKMGSLAFMCTMMSNLMPSLASMDDNSLVANVAGLSILVITIIGNVCIEMRTHLLFYWHTTFVIVCFLLFLLVILICFAMTLPTSKNIFELKYQEKSKTIFDDQNPQQNSISNVEELRQVVERYWIMTESGSPQFVMASNLFSFASASTCAYIMIIHISYVLSVVTDSLLELRSFSLNKPHESVYKGSVIVIFITQSIGIIVASIAPIFRTLTILRLNRVYVDSWGESPFVMPSIQEKWTEKMIEWKESRISSLSSSHRSRVVLPILRNLLVSLCITFHKATLTLNVFFWSIPWIFVKVVMFCSNLISPTMESSHNDGNEDLSNYVLLLVHDIPLAKRTMKRIPLNVLIKKAEKKQHKNLVNFLDKSFGFEGVAAFDTDQVPSLLPPGKPEPVNSWSLPIISLTCIAIALPNIEKKRVDDLFESVGEGLLYTHLVEESLNKAPEYVNVRRATLTVWHEVESKSEWMNNTLKRNAYRGQTPRDIINLFVEKAEEIIYGSGLRSHYPMPIIITPKEIAANSMYRIAKTIVHTCERNDSVLSEDALFTQLSAMIADILAACLTSIPRVILMRCHESAIEKREASVLAAIDLLGRTTEMIRKLETRELPHMDRDKMGFIDDWHQHLKQLP